MPFNLSKNLNLRRIDNLNSIQRAASLSLVTLFIVLISWPVGTHKIANFYNAILPHNQTFTELAFNNVYNLPTTIPANNQISFSFWVHNVEGRNLVYPYTIIIKSGNTSTVIKKGEFYLADNHQASIKENVTLPSTSNNNSVSTPVAPVANNSTYTVVSGDNMWGIAQNNNIPLSQLEAINPQINDPNLIFPGQSINITGAVAHVTVKHQPTRSQVEITLTNLNQTIDFWLKGNN